MRLIDGSYAYAIRKKVAKFNGKFFLRRTVLPLGREVIGAAPGRLSGRKASGKRRGGLSFSEKIFERLFEARRHEKSTARRELVHEELEYRTPGFVMVQIGLDHVELIEVGEQFVGCRTHSRPVEARSNSRT